MEYDINTVNRMIMGNKYLIQNKIWKFIRTHWDVFEYIKSGRLKEAVNLLYTIYYVPGGEGTLQILYRFGLDRFYTRFPDLAPIPRYFEIETTTICNKKCVFCENIHWEKGSQVRRHLTFDEFKYTVDQFPNVRWANMTGEGSAFLNKDYWKMLRYLNDKYKTAIYLVDHLSDLSHEELDELIHLVKGLYISMDGATKATYEKLKQGCSFDAVIGNIEHLIKRKRSLKLCKPEIHFRYVIVKDNVNEIPLFIDLINSLGRRGDFDLTTINFTGLLYFDSIKQFYVSTLNEDLISEIKKRMNKGVYFRFEHTIEQFNPPLEKCYYWMEPYIMMEGYVLPCCGVLMSNQRPSLRQNSFGNVFKNNFKDIWNSERYRLFRKTIVNPKGKVPVFCVGCRQFKTEGRIKQYGIDRSV